MTASDPPPPDGPRAEEARSAAGDHATDATTLIDQSIATHNYLNTIADDLRRSKPGHRRKALTDAAAKAGSLTPLHAHDVTVLAVLWEAARPCMLDATGDDPNSLREVGHLIVEGLCSGMTNPLPVEDLPYYADEITTLDRIAYRWERTPLSSRNRHRLNTVMNNVLRIAYEEERHTNLPLSIHDLGGVEAPLARTTIINTLAELEDQGWLELIRPGRPGHAARYTLRLSPLVAITTPASTDVVRYGLDRLCPLEQHWKHIDPWHGPDRAGSTWLHQQAADNSRSRFHQGRPPRRRRPRR